MLLKFKRKLGITTHFSKKINQQILLKAIKYKARYGVLLQIEASVLPERELFKQFAIIEKSVTPGKKSVQDFQDLIPRVIVHWSGKRDSGRIQKRPYFIGR